MLNFFVKISDSRFEDIFKCMEACLKTFLDCTLPQKKRNFNLPIFPWAPSHVVSCYKILPIDCSMDIEKCMIWKCSLECTLPQKKRNFNLPIFPGARRFLTLTQGHVMIQVQCQVQCLFSFN